MTNVLTPRRDGPSGSAMPCEADSPVTVELEHPTTIGSRFMDSVFPAHLSDSGSQGAAVLRRCAIGIGAVLLAGCVPAAVTPNVALDVPAAYRQAGRIGGLEDHATDWWTGFRSAELTRLIEQTEIANFDIAAAIGRVEQADAQASQAGAALLPSITANDSFTRSKSSTSTINSGSSTFSSGGKPRNDLLASFSASYQLDFWGKHRATLVAAQDNASATRWDRQTVTLTSLASTATTYYTILSARERIAFAKQDVVDSSRVLKLIQDRVKFGTATSLDEAQQAALVANLKASIPPLQVIVEQNLAALAILLGRAPERVVVSGKSVLDAHVPTIAPGIPSEVLTQRPDVQHAEALLSSEHASLVAARAAFFPTITLTAQGGFESLALKTLFSPASTFYTAAAGLAQPIFDGGLLQGQFDQVKGRQDELLADYKKAVITAFSDVEKALAALRLLAQQEELTRQSLVASRKAYDLSEDRLKNGVLDVVTLLQTEQTLFTTQDTLTQVRLSRLTQAVALYQALGGAYAVKVKSGS
jgi:multidrug efflux system outer membrane protein